MNEELNEMIAEMFDNYLEGGMDLDTEQSLQDVFFMIFSDAVNMTIAVLDAEEDEEESEGE